MFVGVAGVSAAWYAWRGREEFSGRLCWSRGGGRIDCVFLLPAGGECACDWLGNCSRVELGSAIGLGMFFAPE